MAASTMFQSSEARATIEGWYDRFLARVPAPTESRVVTTRFGDTHVLVAGPASAPPLVILHGAMASAAHLMPELGPLLSRYRVYAPDVLGQSVKSADARVPVDGAAYGEWFTDVLDGLSLTRTHLLGVSWGGFVALRAAAVAPARIDRLVLAVPAGVVPGATWAGITRIAIPMALYRAFPSPARLERIVSALLTTLDDDWVPYMGDAFRSYKMDMRVPPMATREALAGFDRPTLVFAASDDIVCPGPPLLARMKEILPHAEVELLENCRHSPPTNDAFRTMFTGRITRFLGAEAAPPAP